MFRVVGFGVRVLEFGFNGSGLGFVGLGLLSGFIWFSLEVMWVVF